MRKLKFLSLFLTVQSLQEETHVSKCLDYSSEKTFGDLKYIASELKDCVELIVGDQDVITGVDQCTTTPTTRRSTPIVSDVICAIPDDSKVCPNPPKGCTASSSAIFATGTCKYVCTDQNLECPNETDLKYPFGLTENDVKTWCFKSSYSSCVLVENIENDNNQEKQSCNNKPCGFSEEDKYKLTFDKITFKNTYDTGDTTAAPNVFGCSESKSPSGCSCVYNNSSKTTMECSAASFTESCKENNCQVIDADNNKICYEGQPIMNYDSILCDVLDTDKQDENIFYCKRALKALLPCGNLEHDCGADLVENKYSCECIGYDTDIPCPSLPLIDGKCLIESIPLSQPMDECEKRACLDINFIEKDSCPDDDFSQTLWQCYDDFEFVDIITNTTTENFEAQKKYGTYKDLASCLTATCIDGNCLCDDSEEAKARDTCKALYLSKKNLSTIKREESIDVESTKIEFQCYSYNETLKAINDVNNDVTLPSECRELKPPTASQNAECPGLCNTKLLSFGFYDCQCDAKCSYDCGNSKYESVLNNPKPNDWNDSINGDYYSSYTCEKDNLVMIICTSIFVPLGVAGIAAGVYFFFFHESSEVAPVENDSELASTNSPDLNQTDGDKEETHSDIAKIN